MPRRKIKGPTAREYQVLRFVHEYRLANGYSPSAGDISRELRVARATAWYAVRRLARKGFVQYTPKLARTLTVTPQGLRFLGEQE